MAAQTLVLSVDRCTKNYYIHRDSDTLEWRRIPWDLEDTFPVDYRDGVEGWVVWWWLRLGIDPRHLVKWTICYD